MILPILTYCPFTTFGATPPSLESRIESIKNRARKIIGKSSIVPSFNRIKSKRIDTYVHRCIIEDVCENFVNYFTLNSSNISTRNSKIMIKVKPEVARSSFYFQGVIVYNNLIREIHDEVIFWRHD